MNGAQRDTIEEIKKLVEEESIETEAALRLTLAGQLIITQELVETRESMDRRIDTLEEDVERLRTCVNKKTDRIEKHLEDYPSIVWFWIHRRKSLIIILLVIMLTYTVLFGWVNISDIRQAVLYQLGLPPDLGIGPPPTPMP